MSEWDCSLLLARSHTRTLSPPPQHTHLCSTLLKVAGVRDVETLHDAADLIPNACLVQKVKVGRGGDGEPVGNVDALWRQRLEPVVTIKFNNRDDAKEKGGGVIV